MIDLGDVWLAEPEDYAWAEEFLAQYPEMAHDRPIEAYPGVLVFVVPQKLGVIVVVPVAGLLSGEMHVAIDPKARGSVGIRAGRAAVKHCLDRGLPLYGETPLENRAARRYAAICGGKRIGELNGKEVRVWVAEDSSADSGRASATAERSSSRVMRRSRSTSSRRSASPSC